MKYIKRVPLNVLLLLLGVIFLIAVLFLPKFKDVFTIIGVICLMVGSYISFKNVNNSEQDNYEEE